MGDRLQYRKEQLDRILAVHGRGSMEHGCYGMWLISEAIRHDRYEAEARTQIQEIIDNGRDQ